MANVNTVNETLGLESKSNEWTYRKAIWSTAKYAKRLQPWKARDLLYIYIYDKWITLFKKFSKFFVLHTKPIKEEGGRQAELRATWVIVFLCDLD